MQGWATGLRAVAAAGLCLGLALAARANDVPVMPAASTDAAASTAAPAAEAAASAPKVTCVQATDLALRYDLQTATAQQRKAEPAEISRHLDAAITHWQQAADVCEGRARDRATRNLADDQRTRASLDELMVAGKECSGGQKDAAALQDLARQALGERRWQDAAQLYRKAGDQWDLAAERCTGTFKVQAEQRRDATAMDAHNAEFCAPRFERAREVHQRLRNAGGALSPTEKQTQQQVVETLWRDAATQCRGPALDLARSNAQQVARDRGTAWVSTPLADAKALPVPAAGLATAAPAPTSTPTSTPTSGAGLVRTSAPVGAPAPAFTSTATAAPAALPATSLPPAAPAEVAPMTTPPAGGPSSPPPLPSSAPDTPAPDTATPAPNTPTRLSTLPPPGSPPQAMEVVTEGGVRMAGRFSRDRDGNTLSGDGSIVWPNGDRYDGQIVSGLRQGTGRFTGRDGQVLEGQWQANRLVGEAQLRYANGDAYRGPLVNDLPEGRGRMEFASGDVYTGDLMRGRPHGSGVYVWRNGMRYDGAYVEGVATGRGHLRFANGNDYQGELLAGQPHGKGTLVFTTGDTYTGGFVAGKPDGQGTYQWKSGSVYAGEWKAGLKDGRGTMKWPNGNRWEGVFKADAQTDDGELIEAR